MYKGKRDKNAPLQLPFVLQLSDISTLYEASAHDRIKELAIEINAVFRSFQQWISKRFWTHSQLPNRCGEQREEQTNTPTTHKRNNEFKQRQPNASAQCEKKKQRESGWEGGRVSESERERSRRGKKKASCFQGPFETCVLNLCRAREPCCYTHTLTEHLWILWLFNA